MAQTDPEDGFDQIMVQSWNSVAQQLRTLHNELSGDRARRRERAERAVQNERYEQTRRQQQSIRLEQWEMDNRERLNKGFESTLNATVLADGDGWRKMRDSSLLQGWMVADQLEGNDPGYRRQIIEAKARLKDEWSKRHPETHIDAAADQLTNHVNITYTDQSPALQATLNAFNTAGVPVDLQRVEDTQAFQAAHGDDATFFVDSRLTGQWTGYDHDRIVDAVMCAPVNGVDDAAYRRVIDELSELLEHFQWLNPEDVRALMRGEDPDRLNAIAEEFADVMMYGLQLTRTLNIDITEQILRKIDIVDRRPAKPGEKKR